MLLNLPEWFVEGLVSYIGEEWNADLDNQLRDRILVVGMSNLPGLTGEDADLQVILSGISSLRNTAPAIFRICCISFVSTEALENGFLFVLGTSSTRP